MFRFHQNHGLRHWNNVCFSLLIFAIFLSYAPPVNAGQPNENGRVALTEGERAWLSAHPVITIAPDPYFAPIEFFDEKGRYVGISADYIAILEKELGVKFRTIRCKTWDEVLEKAKSGEVDALPAAAQTPERSEYLLFCDPHIVLPGVIIVRKDVEETLDMKKLCRMKVSVAKGYVWQELMQADYPDINLDLAPDLRTALRNVSLGVTDAMVATLPAAIYYIEKEGITNLCVAGETGYFARLSFASRRDMPELNSIVKKTLDQFTRDEKKAILDKWIHLGQKSFFKSSEFMGILLISLLQVLFILMLILIWRHYQKKFLRLYPEEKAVSLNIVFFVAAMFILLGVVVCLNEFLDIPNLVVGAPKTPINYQEALLETILIYLLGLLTVFYLVHDIYARKRIEESLRKSETKYRLLAENVADVIWTADMDLRLTYISPSVFTLMGYTPEEFKNMPLDRYMPPASLELAYMEVEREMAVETSGHTDPNRIRTLEVEYIRKDGSVIWVEMKMSSLRDPDDQWTGILGVARDITDRKQAEEKIKSSLIEKEALLSEIHHRVKNNMQIITSLLFLQSKDIKDERALSLIRNCEDRIRSMSLVHEKLYLSKDLSRIDFHNYMEDLSARLFQVHRVDSNAVSFSLHIKDVSLSIETAIPLGLIANELISNAIKHAFSEGKKGNIAVELHFDRESEKYTLTVTDDGIGIPEEIDYRNTETFGLQLAGLLTEQLNGTMELDRSEGTSFRVTFKEREYRKRI